MRWTQWALLALWLLIVLWFFLWIAPIVLPALSHSSGGGLSAILLSIMNSPQTVTGGPGPFVLFLLCLCVFLMMNLDTRLKKQRTYGSAGYATFKEARSFHRVAYASWRLLRIPINLMVKLLHNAGVRQKYISSTQKKKTASLFITGNYRGRVIALSEKEQEEHILLTASTGGGKSTLEIIPNLIREQGSRSLFIADLKNELYRLTAGALSQYHQIWWFAPTYPQQSHHYNPLAHITNAMEANMFADCWVKNTGEGDDPFWANCARYLICAIVLHLRATESNAPFSRLADFIASQSFDEIKDILTSSPSEEAKRKATTFLSNMTRNERLVGSIMTDIGNRFQLFDSDNVRIVTTANDIDFHRMVDDPIALYLSIPRSEVDIYRPLMSCFTMQMFRTWEQRAANSSQGSLPRGIACYMDEFANIGHIPGYANFISTARYLRVSLIMVIQNFAQLDAAYGSDAGETIRANANTHLLLPGAGLRECTYYSERIGHTTVPTWTRTTKDPFWLRTDNTWTQGETQRRLLTPEELRTMPPQSVLMLRSTLSPMVLKATPYYKDASLAQLVSIPYHNTHVHPEMPISVQKALPSVDRSLVAAEGNGSQSKPHSSPDVQKHFLED